MKYFIPVILFLLPLFIILRQITQKRKLRKKGYWKQFSELKNKNEEKSLQLAKIREEIFSQEKEIKKVTYLYESVKRMAKILTWEEMIKLLKETIDEYLNLSDYVFFIPERINTKESSSYRVALKEGYFFTEDWLKKNFTDELFFSSIRENKTKIVSFNGEKMLFLPLGREEEILGLLWARIEQPLGRTQLKMSESELINEAEILARELVLGLEKAKLYSEVERMSRFDGLTGLYRRNYFETRLTEELIRTRRYGAGFSLALVDIDYFKKINDTYGHQVGDQVLQRLGTILKENLYETDIVARYGGEEFVILLPRAESEGVKKKIENLREKIAAEEFILDWGELKITVSIGLAHYPKNGSTAEEILHSADQSLYSSKEKGRNCLTEYDEISIVKK